jgi:bacteriocin resistance YdeI/OmpD-like protein
MTQKEISGGTVHELPTDLSKALAANSKVLALWEDITSLARNEFICWVENAKGIETRNRRIQRTCEELLEGQRRPCCWMGCVHRTDKSMSPSQRWVLDKQAKKSS